MKYRKFDPRFWNDEKIRQLTDDGRLAFIFILTHPAMTALGAMRATLQGLAAELGWPGAKFRRAVQPAITMGMIECNEGVAYVGMPNFLRYNEPEGPNSVKAWLAAIDLIPECPEKRALLLRCRRYLDSRSQKFKDAIAAETWEAIRDAFSDAIGDGKAKPCPIQEHEQEPEQEPEQGQEPEGSPKPPPGVVAHRWLDVLNQTTGAAFKPTSGNLRPISDRIAEGHTLDQAAAVVQSKAREWTGTEYAKFLRPATLYGPKFDSYLQAARTHGNGINHAWEGEIDHEVKT